MSRIKDLFAVENGDDDLVPVEDNTTLGDYEQAVQKKILDNISGIKEEMLKEADFGVDTDDNGNEEICFENFYSLCHSTAEWYLGELIEEQHVDLSDTDFELLNVWLGDWLADELADWETEQCEEVADDNKYILDELRERNGQC